MGGQRRRLQPVIGRKKEEEGGGKRKEKREREGKYERRDHRRFLRINDLIAFSWP